MRCFHGPCIAALHVWVALIVPGCVHVCLHFAVGVGSYSVRMFHVLILMSILMSQSSWIRLCIRVTYYYYNKRNSKRGLSPDDVTGWRTADDVTGWRTADDVTGWRTADDVTRWRTADDVTGWRTADDALKGCEVLTITVTVSAYFIHPSGKLELSFNLIH